MTEKTTKRSVHTSDRVPPKGRPKLWAYGYEDLAALFGVTVDRIRQMASRKNKDGQPKEPFNFGSLEAVCREWLRRKAGKI